jgi:hypothetical protein
MGIELKINVRKRTEFIDWNFGISLLCYLVMAALSGLVGMTLA